MAGKITDLGANSGFVDADTIEVVDVSNTTMAATGTNVQGTLANLATSPPFTSRFTMKADVFKQAQSINAQTGTSYTLIAGDAGLLVTFSNAAATTLTLPSDATATIAIGTIIDFLQLGTGQVTVVAGGGATVRLSGLTGKARAQYSRFGTQKIAANTWSVYGDLAAA